MQQDEPNISRSHSLFLHRLIDNEQANSVTFMKLDTHTTLFRDGSENRYLTNLVIAGRNYIEIYAIFQNEIALSMGVWPIFEDIKQVQQWDKNIVVSTSNKIVGLVYEDCMVKNSFMISLEFLELGFRENINTYCDRQGYYMVISTAREILLCVSQKSVLKYKARPFSHSKMSVVEEDIKWNRLDHQAQIVDIIKIELIEFDLAKIEYFHFCDQLLYFLGYSNKSNNEKSLYEIEIFKIFSDNEREFSIIKLFKIENQMSECYVIKKDGETEFLEINVDGTMEINSQKGKYTIENESFVNNSKEAAPNRIKCKKTNNPSIFPMHVIYHNKIRVYERFPNGTFHKKEIKLSNEIEIEYCDFHENLFSYCNMYEVGLIFLKSGQRQEANSKLNQQENDSMVDEKEEKFNDFTKIVLKESFGSIIDFSVRQNLVIVENTFKKHCQLKLLRKGIVENPKTIIMRPKKISLETIADLKFIRSFEELLQEYELTESECEIKRIRTVLLNFLLIQTKTNKPNSFDLYKLIDQQKEVILKDIEFYSIIKNNINLAGSSKTDSIGLEQNEWYLVFWNSSKELLYYSIDLNDKVTLGTEIKLRNKLENVDLWKGKGTPQIRKIKEYFVSVDEETVEIFMYKWNSNEKSTVQIIDKTFNQPLSASMVKINEKSITFKKKEKDIFILEVLVLVSGHRLEIYEVSVDSGNYRLSQCTDNIGEGLPIILPGSLTGQLDTAKNHELRAITCPEYVLADKNISSEILKVLKMHTYQYQNQSFFFIINSKEELQVYKKYYCTNVVQASKIDPSPQGTVGLIETGYLYHRQPLQLHITKKFKYEESQAFVDVGCGILRVCNLVFFKGELMEFPEGVRSCFCMEKEESKEKERKKEKESEVWAILKDCKIKLLITDGKVVSHYLTTPIEASLTQEIMGIEATNENYIIYSREGFQVFDKEFKPLEKINLNEEIRENKEYILAMCAFDHYLAISYYNYCEDETGEKYKSIKFKIRIYNTITNKKIIEKDNSIDEPVMHIRHIAPDKLVLVTSSNVSVNTIKNNQSLENFKNKHFSKRAMLSCFSYIPEKVGTEPGYMLFGGLYGGLSFCVGQWIDKDKLDEIWFENLKCGINEVQIFRYGGQYEVLKALIADDCENIIVLDLKPKCAEKIGDFHIGSIVNSIKKRYEIPYIGSADGCIRQLFPIKLKDPEMNFLEFQEEITKSIPLLAGFNNRDSRLMDQREKTYKLTSSGNIVDGDVIKSFLSLTETLKSNIYDSYDLKLEDIRSQLLGQI